MDVLGGGLAANAALLGGGDQGVLLLVVVAGRLERNGFLCLGNMFCFDKLPSYTSFRAFEFFKS